VPMQGLHSFWKEKEVPGSSWLLQLTRSGTPRD
jgi:hypothetical protein